MVALLLAVGLTACGASSPTAGPTRSTAEIDRCLQDAHLGGQVTPVPQLPVATRRGITTIIDVSVGGGPGIAVFRDPADASRQFRLTQSSEAELLDGNVILIAAGPGPGARPPSPQVETCAFGPRVRPQRSAFAIEVSAPHPSGYAVVLESGCLGCHRIGSQGNNGPGGDLSDIGRELSAARLAQVLADPAPPMPSYTDLERSSPRNWRALIAYLHQLGTG